MIKESKMLLAYCVRYMILSIACFVQLCIGTSAFAADNTYALSGANVVVALFRPEQIRYQARLGARTFRLQLINLHFNEIKKHQAEKWLDPDNIRSLEDAKKYEDVYLNYDAGGGVWVGIAKQLDIIKNQIIPLLREDPELRTMGIKLIIDLHSPPGVFLDYGDPMNPEDPRHENPIKVAYIDQPLFADIFVRVWRRIAETFRDDDEVIGFDLENEPTGIHRRTLRSRYNRVIERIRSVRARQDIIIEAEEDPRSLSRMVPYSDPLNKIIYSIHWYFPHKFNAWDGTNSSQFEDYRARIDDALLQVRTWQRANGMPPVWVGEYSVDHNRLLGDEGIKYLKYLNLRWLNYGWGNSLYRDPGNRDPQIQYNWSDFYNNPSIDAFLEQQINVVSTYWRNAMRLPPFQSFQAQFATGLHPIPLEGWDLSTVKDRDGDGRPELATITKNGWSGRTEVHMLSSRTNYAHFIIQVGTILHPTDDNWTFQFADHNRDGIDDLYCISRVYGFSGRVEVHVINGVDFQSFIGHYATWFYPDGSSHLEWRIADWNRDGINDLCLVIRHSTASGRVELHVADGSTGYSSILLHCATLLAAVNDNWTFQLADMNRDGALDLIGVDRSSERTKSTQVTVLDGANGYQRYQLRALSTALHETNAGWDFFPVNYGSNGNMELMGVLRWGYSNTTEVHILDF